MTAAPRGSVVILSGCPGTGKTTLARALGDSLPNVVHIRGDDFFAFLTRPIPPVLPESRTQNTTVMRAIARSARAFAENGYQVVIDGVIGPWFLDVFREELGSEQTGLQYVVLRAELTEALRRGTTRPEPVDERIVRAMHPQFADLGPFEHHAVQTSGETSDGVLAILLEGLRVNRFALSASVMSSYRVAGLDHVQLAMPAGREDDARAFYGSLLGLTEMPKPERLAKRGGAWFESPLIKIHLGVETDFRPARKAHPGILIQGLDALLERLRAEGYTVTQDEPLPGYKRAYVDDPFGNRLELLEREP